MKKMADLICFVGGVFLTVYFIFDFSPGPVAINPENIHFYYFYEFSSRLGLALGASLICLGFILRRWKQQ